MQLRRDYYFLPFFNLDFDVRNEFLGCRGRDRNALVFQVLLEWAAEDLVEIGRELAQDYDLPRASKPFGIAP